MSSRRIAVELTGTASAPKPIKHKLITGDKFVAQLMELGIVGKRTRRVVIDAAVGEAIMLTIEEFGDDRLLQLLDNGGVTVAHSPEEAICR